jgi:hypothetical protein
MLTKLVLKPGINREITSYSGEGGWRACDKVRFRQGYPEKIGGWQRISLGTFKGVCRSLMEWVTLGSVDLRGVGTNLKYYVELGGQYYDITPIRATSSAGSATFDATTGSSIVKVTHTAHGANQNDFVTFSDTTSLGGLITDIVLNKNFQIINVIDLDNYEIDVGVQANASDSGNGGALTVAAYEIHVGPETTTPSAGWGSGGWGTGQWGFGTSVFEPLRIWSHANYGEDLIYGPVGGSLYYWSPNSGVNTRGTVITGNDTPTVHNSLLVSDTSRFVICFGCNEIGSNLLDPMLVRWSDQEQYNNWTPAITNQAGGQRLSSGSSIVTARQNRQEILIWTDVALYSMQYQGPPYVWGFQLMGDNVSIASTGAATVANGVAYWMGTDKFYRYDGRVQPLRCDLQKHVFGNIEDTQREQITSGTVEQFNEIWWFYPSLGSTVNDKYVVYNYLEDIWYYGNISRTAWLDSPLESKPIGATQNRLVIHETGSDDATTENPQPIASFITSSEVDIGDGDKFAFVRRMLPDVTFEGSSTTSPRVTMELWPMNGSGSGFRSPASVGGNATQNVTRSATVPIEQFTNQVNIRVRGRQIAMTIRSTDAGVRWQLGSPRVDTQPDGYRG